MSTKSIQHAQVLLFRGGKDSHFCKLLDTGLELVEKYPEILEKIDEDLDDHGLAKKKLRKADIDWGNQKLDFDTVEYIDKDKSLVLESGRKRMPPVLVLVFMLIRGYFGGFKREQTRDLIAESESFGAICFSLGLTKIPKPSTIIENVNALSEKTQRLILDKEIELVLNEGLDDLKHLYFDSTSISASGIWPTESGTISALMSRIESGIRTFAQFGYQINLPKSITEKLDLLANAHTSISLRKGKKESKKHTKKKYREILRTGKELVPSFDKALQRAKNRIGDMMPSIRVRIEALVEWIEADLHNVQLCMTNARQRVLEGKKVDAKQKVLGVADQDAEMIVKGGRDPVYGYKPQIGRTEKGLIIAVDIPCGNASDSGEMKKITDQAIDRTTILPDVLSYDDGYTNSEARFEYLKQGIKVVSFSGAKGKRQIEEDEWDSLPYKTARNKRSMVESTMSVLKQFFNLSRFSRRGQEAVTKEILEKVIVNNLRTIHSLRSSMVEAKAA